MSVKRADGIASICAMILILIVALGVLAIIQAASKPALPLYKQGECIRNTNEPTCEKWEKCPFVIAKVIEVGKKHYRLLRGQYKPDLNEVYVHVIEETIENADQGTEKVSCPEELNDPKTLEKANAATEH